MANSDQQDLDGPRVYLAGPEVFLEDAKSIGAEKRRICAAHGLLGVFPGDKKVDTEGLTPAEAAMAIYRVNCALMDGCDLAIANMTPFRGPSMDVGTAFEMGYMRALGRPVFGYSNAVADYLTRVRSFFGGPLGQRGKDPIDPSGLSIENFGLTDNLMLEGAVRDFAESVVCRETAPAALYTDLEAFTVCVARAAESLAEGGSNR